MNKKITIEKVIDISFNLKCSDGIDRKLTVQSPKLCASVSKVRAKVDSNLLSTVTVDFDEMADFELKENSNE